MNPYKNFNFAATKDDLLVAVDLQECFVNGVLGSDAARAIVKNAVWFYNNFQGDRVATQDTHDENYLNTQEGRNLPIVHGQKGKFEWRLIKPLQEVMTFEDVIIEKPGFGSLALADIIKAKHYKRIFFIGLDTGYCVISNAVIAKAADPEAEICIMSNLCACVTLESHETALKAMKTLQMTIIDHGPIYNADQLETSVKKAVAESGDTNE